MKRTVTRVPGDEKFINKETLHRFCNTNEAFLQGPVRGFVLEFPGLGGGSCLGGKPEMKDYDTPYTRFLGEHGILHAFMFSGPWSWMNRGAVRLSDNVAAAIKEKYNLAEEVPFAVIGGSMGGLGALIYTVYSEYVPVACVAACPCTDVLNQMNIREHFPRTYIRAVLDYNMPLEEGLKTISPVEQLDNMPKIPYMILNNCDDELFAEAVLDDYVEKLESRGHTIEYVKLPGCGHGVIPSENMDALFRFVLDHIDAACAK